MRRYSSSCGGSVAGRFPSRLATVFATVHGVVHDPQHRPIAAPKSHCRPRTRRLCCSATTNGDGEFELPAAPIGVYRLTVEASGFATATQTISLASGTNPGAAYSC